MAHPDIVIAGAQFQTVPSIVVPKAGGGEATFYDMDGDMAWMGKDAECINESFFTEEDTLDNTTFNGWTPSTTAKALVATKAVGTFTASGMDEREYYIVWECACDPVYDGTETQKALPQHTRAYMVQQLFRRPNSTTNIQAENANGNVCATLLSANWMRYYGTTTGSSTYTWAASNGFYFSVTAATFSSSTSDAPTVTVKTPVFYAKCSTTYLSTGNAAKVVQASSNWSIKCKLYRVKQKGVLRGMYDQLIKIINE